MEVKELEALMEAISKENELLKVARKYRVKRLSEAADDIQRYRKEIQEIDRTISSNTDKYMDTADFLKAMLKEKEHGL